MLTSEELVPSEVSSDVSFSTIYRFTSAQGICTGMLRLDNQESRLSFCTAKKHRAKKLCSLGAERTLGGGAAFFFSAFAACGCR